MAFSVQRESQFNDFVQSELEPFWHQNATPGVFKNADGLDIHFVKILASSSRARVVISPGRVEGYLKYKELAYDFYHQGYDVFIIDHQGQGLSSRKLENKHKGYVARFDDYVDDLATFIESYVADQYEGDLHLVCHSMGGAIGLRYIQQFPNTFKKAVFSSPMWGFIAGQIPERLSRSMIKFGHLGTEVFGRESGYFFGAKNYYRKAFTNNDLTTSEARYQYFRDLYEQEPELQLGGITFAWLQAAIEALDLAKADLTAIRTQLLVLQAEHDTVVDNNAHNSLLRQLNNVNSRFNVHPLVIRQAKHEIFIESDDKRNTALNVIFKFLTELSS